jgi:hypothetical protein
LVAQAVSPAISTLDYFCHGMLRLQPVKAPVDMLVIDHVERPIEN